MSDPRAPEAQRAEPPHPAPDHGRHRAPRGAAVRRRALALSLVLAVAAAAVLAVLVLRQPPGRDAASTGAPPTAPGTTTSAGTSTGTTGGGGRPSTSSQLSAQGSVQGAAQAAALWLAGQAPQGGGVAVDPELYDEVATSAQLASRLVPAPTAAAGGQLGARWVVAGPALRTEAAPGSWAAQALASSRVVAAFGDGDGRVEVRELEGAGPTDEPVVPLAAGEDLTTSPPVTSAPPRATATPADPAALAELQRNSRLDFSPRAREALSTEQVDLRLAALLVQLAVQQPLSVADLPSNGGSEPLRTVVLDGVDGRAVGADPDALALLQRQLTAQDPAYRASVAQERDGDTQVLRIALPSAGM